MHGWFDVTLIFLALAVISWAVIRLIESAVPTRRKYFFCSPKEANVAVDFVYHPATSQNVGVKSCSLFQRGQKITCDKECLRLSEDRMVPHHV